MHHFAYRGGALHAEDVDLARIAREIGTPFYCYSSATIERHFHVFSAAFADCPALVCYAMKANSNQAVLATLARMGAGMDVVSEGELRRARAAGVPADKIIFSGVGKTRAEMALALEEDILCFNVESEPELEALSEIASARGRIARIAIRVNPDVDARTHAKISTGKSENKFGIPISRARAVYARARALPGLAVSGVDMHIGSQITDMQPFDDAFALLADFVRELRSDGCSIDHIDVGGGLGIPYRFDNDPPPRPRALRGNRRAPHARTRLQGLFRTGTPHRRQRRRARDLGDLRQARRRQDFRHRRRGDERPDPSDALRRLSRMPAAGASRPPTRRGCAPTSSARCAKAGTSSPSIATWRKSRRAILLAVMSAGAYGAVQAGTYNTRLLVPETLVKGAEYALVRPRPTYADLIGLDKIPPWLRSG